MALRFEIDGRGFEPVVLSIILQNLPALGDGTLRDEDHSQKSSMENMEPAGIVPFA